MIASGAAPECFKLLWEDVHNTLNELEALHSRWEALNANQLAYVTKLSKSAKELGITNRVSAKSYMLYNTVYICVIHIKQSLSPSPENIALRNAAAMKIANCLTFKEYEKRNSTQESAPLGFVATEMVWQGLGRFEFLEGRKLAEMVKLAVMSKLQNLTDQTP